MRSLLLLAAIGVLAGCAAPGAADEPAERAATWDLAPQRHAELDLAMEAGDAISYRLAATAPVRWDIHSHAPDGRVSTYAEGTADAASGNFTAPAEGTYSLYVLATGGAAKVEAHVSGTFEVVS